MNRQIHSAVIFAYLSLCSVACGQIVTPTPTPFMMQSIFDDDTCAPPCWFGLIPGESTVEDVQTLIDTSANQFLWVVSEDEETSFDSEGQLIEGTYQFFWQGDNITLNPVQGWLVIHNNTIYRIRVHMGEYHDLSLQGLLLNLDQPDYIHAYQAPYSGAPRLDFIYLTLRVRLILAGAENCRISSLEQDYWIKDVEYFSPDAANEPVNTIVGEQPQPALAAYSSAFTAYVPQETWNMWLEGDITDSCLGVLGDLPRATQLPTVIPTPILTPTATNP